MKKHLLFLLSLLCGMTVGFAQETVFTYQGRLTDNGSPATGDFEMRFFVYNADAGGSQVGNMVLKSSVPVSGGLFTTELDFGTGVFDGNPRWLEIGVRPQGSGSPFTTLSPRQEIMRVPYAMQAVTAVTAETASSVANLSVSTAKIANGAVTAQKLSNGAGSDGQVLKMNAGQLAWDTDNDTQYSAGVGLNLSGTQFNASFAGSGIANAAARSDHIHDAADIVSGTLADTRLSANVALLDGDLVFSGMNTFSGINLFTNENNSFSGAFTGDGQNLTNIAATSLVGTLSSSQFPANLIWADESTTFTGSIVFDPASGAPFAVGNSTKVENLNAALLDGLDSNAFWKRGGNSGTTPGTDFIGTTDNQPLEFRVAGRRVLSIQPGDVTNSVNIVAGAVNNWISPDVVGSTISGGGSNPGSSNSIAAGFSVVAGGISQVIHTDANYSTISGGLGNTIQTNSPRSSIGGGAGNLIHFTNWGSTISGGEFNRAGARISYATIGGGQNNNVDSNYGTVSGGQNNNLSLTSPHAVISGGYLNTIYENGTNATISGGERHYIADATGGSIGGGSRNAIGGGGHYGAVPGGASNSVSGAFGFAAGLRAEARHSGAFVWADSSGPVFRSSAANQFLIRASGGVGINKTNPATALDVTGTVTATAFSGNGSSLSDLNSTAFTTGTLSDSRLSTNVALLSSSPAFTGTISGQRLNIGNLNSLSGSWNTIAGGAQQTNSANYGFIGGGLENSILPGALYGAIGGGHMNTIQTNAIYATIPGGYLNAATNYAFAAGYRAKANHQGAFVWGDLNSSDIVSTNNNSITMRASGGTRLFSNNSGTAGVYLAPGTGTWASLSDRNAKANFDEVNPREVLEKVAALPISKWNYKGQDKETRHIGPMAQDFHAAFGVGVNETTITTVDADGVALAAIQGLNQKVDEREALFRTELERRDRDNAELRHELRELKKLMVELTSKVNGSGL